MVDLYQVYLPSSIKVIISTKIVTINDNCNMLTKKLTQYSTKRYLILMKLTKCFCIMQNIYQTKEWAIKISHLIYRC